ncbi:hypothetical protein WR25_12314 [Diploscapter pachys]|uniref:glutathione transferase n=1 Tax=Diploscapter pachys TaxID=2018661 RepID=A0A2A2JVL7_9BILA|nr:hypothetical protein WR25_12314 [Diploscapter pachys]
MPSYKLYYFDGRGFGEASRQLFALADVPFEDVRLDREKFMELKPTFPYGQVPVLEVDGVQIPQSVAIARFLAKKFGFAGKTEVEQAIVDGICDQWKDFYAEIKPYYYGNLGYCPPGWEDLEKARTEVLIPARDKFFGFLKNLLNKNKSGFLVEGGVTYADLFITDNMTSLFGWFPGYFEGHPEIEAYYKHVQEIPKLKAWLAKRPKTSF